MATSHPTRDDSADKHEDKAEQVARETAQVFSNGTKSAHDFITKFIHDWSFHLAQALTFGLVTSTIPLGMLLFAIVGQVIGTLNHEAQQQFITHLRGIFPPQILPAEISTSAIQKFSQGSGIWIIASVAAALFFGSRLFSLLEACCDIIYRVPPRPQKEKNLRAIVLVLVFMLLTPLLVITSVIPEQLLSILNNTPINPDDILLHHIAGVISSLLVSFILFEIIYAFVPNHQGSIKTRLRNSLYGSVTAAVVLQIGLLVFPLYTRSYVSGIVGQIAFVLVFLIFFYIVAFITIFGATVNSYFAENIPPTQHDLITRASNTN